VNISPRYATRILFGSALLAIAVWFVAQFPLGRPALAVLFAGYGVCLWRWPKLWLVALPAALPTFDLAPWSGRFFFDEFDALVLLTVGLLALRDRRDPSGTPMPRGLVWALLLLTGSYVLSTLIWLWPPPPITSDSFANYYSPYNSLRVAKGFVWALLLLRPLRQAIGRNDNSEYLLCIGFLLGLAGISIVAAYERWLFPGLLAWYSDYRVSSTFSSMHTGDGPIDVFLATTIPLMGSLAIARRRCWIPAAIGLSIVATYTVIAAAARGPVIAVVIAFGAGVLGLAATGAHRRRSLLAAALGFSALILAAPIALSRLPQIAFVQRFAQTQQDASTRLRHWRNSLALRDSSIKVQLLGMGLGSFPMFHQARSTNEDRAARYSFTDAPRRSLKLWSGGALLYTGQIIAIKPATDYQFRAQVRTAEPNALLTVNLCEIWLLTSRHCSTANLSLQAAPDRWQILSQTIPSESVGAPNSHLGFVAQPRTWLTLFARDAPLGGIEISEISLKDMQGYEVIRNGDFRDGADNWFWTSDRDLPWHTLDLWVQVLFDQGWLGVLALGFLVALTVTALIRQIVRGNLLSAVLLAAITGFMVTGVTVSIFDQPRLALMFYLLCFTALSKSMPPIRNAIHANKSTSRYKLSANH
jgi:hypothetical protein